MSTQYFQKIKNYFWIKINIWMNIFKILMKLYQLNYIFKIKKKDNTTFHKQKMISFILFIILKIVFSIKK